MSKLSILALCCLLIAGIITITGCEVGSATEPIKISPSAVMVKNGQSVQFTASGGYEYTWTLGGSGTASSVMGYLSSTRGPSVIYTSVYDPGESNLVHETISVVSTIPGDAAGTNASSSSLSGGSGSATITHVGADF